MQSLFNNMDDTIARIKAENAAISNEGCAPAAEELMKSERLAKAIETQQKLINLRIYKNTRPFSTILVLAKAKQIALISHCLPFWSGVMNMRPEPVNQ
jgi:hypothetical protein